MHNLLELSPWMLINRFFGHIDKRRASPGAAATSTQFEKCNSFIKIHWPQCGDASARARGLQAAAGWVSSSDAY
jgi:hypothetical protein